VKWARGVHHLTDLAQECAKLAALPDGVRGLPVVGLWAFGDILGEPQEFDQLEVAIVVDLPEVPWLSEPVGADHWANMTRMRKNPIRGLWRSALAPVWNHHIVRPAPVWTVEEGAAENALAAIGDGKGPLVEHTIDNIQNGSYPLLTQVYFYTTVLPGQKMDPMVKEFLRFILSREGQDIVHRDGGYLPLTAALALEQLKKIEAKKLETKASAPKK